MTTQSASTPAGIASAATLARVSRTSAARLWVGIAIVSLTVNVVVRAREAARIIMIAELRRAPEYPVRGAVRRDAAIRRVSGSRARRRRGRGGSGAAAAGDAPGDGVGVAGFGSGAPDCVNTIDVTVKIGRRLLLNFRRRRQPEAKVARLARHERQHRTPEVGELQRRRDRRVHFA